ncbi:hypothetical protein [Pseudescherichia sp.]|uniref:hypothetical protein n=1 Tax=Pseudescherichia sp. TaxID=2055881 RepID=UPI0028A90ED1|nr:hypothetical protein [Pseudescherichia sp.]
MSAAMPHLTEINYHAGREIATCEISLAGNPDTNEQLKRVERFCGYYDALNQEEKKRAIYQHLTGHLPPVSVNEAKALALKARALTGRELGEVARQQIREITAYHAAVNAWFADCDNNWEHIIPQETLVLHYSGQNKMAAQFVAKVNGVVAHTALTYFENQRRHKRHTGTRWLIIDKKKHSQSLPIAADAVFHDALSFYYHEQGEDVRIYNFKGQPLRKVNCSPETSLAAIFDHEVARKNYENTQASLLKEQGDVASAIQLNQRCYAADPLWQQERHNGNVPDKSDAVADVSYYLAIASSDNVTYISSVDAEDQERITLTKITLTIEDKIAAVEARLTATLGREPQHEEMREVLVRFGLDPRGSGRPGKTESSPG